MEAPRLLPGSAPIGNPSDGGGLFFISSVLDVKVNLPHYITPSIRLEKPDDSQLIHIQDYLSGAGTFYGVSYSRASYERELEESQGSLVFGGDLSREEWRYLILSFSGNSYDVHCLLKIASLVYPFISGFAHLLTSKPFGCGQLSAKGADVNAGNLFHSKYFRIAVEPLTSVALDELSQNYRRYSNLNPKIHEGIIRAVELHHSLRNLDSFDPLRVIVCFAVIEMLLTHKQTNKEIGDSLTHQIKTKVSLLSSRLNSPFDYTYFATAAPEKIWDALYHFRSRIAHGEHIDFSSKPLVLLIDRCKAMDFLHDATRKILKHALIEPDLFNALKPI